MSLTIVLKRLPVVCRKKLSASFILLSAIAPCYAQGYSQPDTLRMQTVSVTAISSDRIMPFTIVSVDPMLKEWNSFTDLGKLFQTSSPVFVRRIGTDGLSSLSIRGMSGSHTNVTWNDININAPMNGQIDFTLLPLFAADELTLTMGGGNLKNLSGTMGGSLDISSSAPRKKGMETALSSTTGSSGLYGGALSFSASDGTIFSSRSRIWFRRADNNFMFVNENAPGGPDTLRRVNATVNMGGFLQDFFIRGKRQALSAHFWFNDSFRELPSPVTSVQQNLGETQSDRSFRSVLKYSFNGNIFKTDITAGYVSDINIYAYDLAGIHGDNRSQTFISRAVLHYYGKGPVDIVFNAANEYQSATSESYIKKENRNTVSSSLSIEYEAGEKWFFIAQLREQIPGSALSSPEFTTGATFKPGKDGRILFKANVTRNVKFPSLNDLFWNPGGNPSLKPEISRGGEIGIMLSGQKEKRLYSDFTATLYASNVKDLITWVPVSSSLWSPINILEANLFGAELSSSTYYNMQLLKMKLNASYNFVGKQMLYIPANTGNITLTGNYKWLKLGTTMLWNSRCYTVSDNSEWLPGYFLTEALCGVSLVTKPCKIDIGLTINNILNTDYESVKNYPMPLRSFTLNLIIKPNL